MNISNVVRPCKRIERFYSSTLGIQTYDKDNLYPQRMLALLKNSPTGGTCCSRYENFIFGDGFRDRNLSELVVNRYGDTANDILQLCVRDLSQFGGVSLHLNYDLSGRVVEVQHVPFESCRLYEEDDAGYVPYICTHPDLSGTKTRRGKKLKVSRETVDYLYPFNPQKEVLLSQMEKDGGVESYRGQILWYSTAGRNTYPEPVYDKVVTNLSTDEGLDNVKYRNVRNNFLPAGMLIRKKGLSGAIDKDGRPVGGTTQDEIRSREFDENLLTFQGDTNALAIMDVTVNADEDAPQWVSIKSQNFDKDFTVTESSVTERIYSAFGQEPWYAIRVGKLGFSGQLVAEAYEYYNSYVSKERQALERIFSKVFGLWKEGLPGDFTISPKSYVHNAEQTGTPNATER